MEKYTLRVLGVMTGTSCDGLDAACIEIGPQAWRPLWSESTHFPTSLRDRIMEIQKPNSKFSTRLLLELHRDLGFWYSKSIHSMMGAHPDHFPDLIANHGQTIAHFPMPEGQGMTLQLGDATRIVAQVGITTVSHFREGDLAAGGQGAPLVPLFHQLLAQQLDPQNLGIAIHNLGGISNLTYIGPEHQILAFDTGPGNLWIDAATFKLTQGKSKFDQDGQLALSGKINEQSLQKLLLHPFFFKAPPKSTGRDDFPESLFFSYNPENNENTVATATALTAQSIADTYQKWILQRNLPLKTIYFCGGGAKNKTLLFWIQKLLPTVMITTVDQFNYDSQLIEAQAFAAFGYFSLLGKPLGGSWTGVQGFGPPGHLIPGKNWRDLIKKLNSMDTS